MNASLQTQFATDAAARADCWNRIGVHGNSSCAELERHIHCRNCPVYAAAAAKLLNADPPSEYLAHWTAQVARSNSLAQQCALSVLIFRVGAEWFAVPARVLHEVASGRAVHSIPGRRDGIIMGLANIRGELLVCVSLRRVVRVEVVTSDEAGTREQPCPRLLVLQQNGRRVACPVDQVHGIERFRADEHAAVPATVGNAATSYTQAVLTWQRKSVGLLDEHRLFNSINRGLA